MRRYCTTDSVDVNCLSVRLTFRIWNSLGRETVMCFVHYMLPEKFRRTRLVFRESNRSADNGENNKWKF